MMPTPECIAVLVEQTIATLHRGYPEEAKWLSAEHVGRLAAAEVMGPYAITRQ